MPRFKQTSEILKLMHDKEHIRNIGIIAHIDHGKTTMSDSLLAMAGLMAPSRAGETRALDYLEEEQRRGITIKTANISLLYEEAGEQYVINLIDTPGHVDFSGKVTRALRALDGCILLVDAVEEFQIMTEVRLRVALEERVKPVLYINKFDRLITELKMDAEAVQRKLLRIISQFNTIVQTYGGDEIRNRWTINAADGTVAFGSALDRWGFTLPMLQRKGLKFSDIVDYYREGKLERLQEMLPLHEAILEMAVEHIPNPLEAQPFRIPAIWRGDVESDIGRAMMKLEEDGPLVICITNVIIDPQAGIISTGRIFSGTIGRGSDIYLLMANREYKIQQVSIYMGQYREVVESIPSGNIVALLGIEQGRAGETIVDYEHRDGAVGFEQIRYISEPVLTVAVEPKRPVDLPRLIDAMTKLSIQDPNLIATINQETGEYLLSGMGELHLEIAIKDLWREHKVDVVATEPTVVYRETIREEAGPFMGKSPNKHNRLWFTIKPLDRSIIDLIREGDLSEALSRRMRLQVLVEKAGWSSRDAREVVAVDQNANILVDATTGVQYLREVRDHIAGGFHWALESGPYAGEAVRGVQINLTDAQLHEDAVHRGPAQMMPATRGALYAAILSAGPTLLEPIYKIQVRIPPDELGSVTGLISRKRGSIHEVEQRGPVVTITGYLPVSETLGLSQEMRAATSGSAFWQSTFDHWAPVPDSMLEDVVKRVRERKGLTPEPPPASRYIVRE
ncbi:elongation factor EF-2 [miscellaneous Crenarchaeota group-15 archaeon DG-45]|uniref:Elongation factor 2 n=1 Tax=miscellaneous Crenarchaeota group-15 archaeon DG-45 TaxID=1685127 RepID=A0A0M0BLX5_9ARCH|nr:MAG: elongation factor EF-2 [miscellaneous Crenarchaeota group-15 archaeon DG-45]